jgi:hypothetical protein
MLFLRNGYYFKCIPEQNSINPTKLKKENSVAIFIFLKLLFPYIIFFIGSPFGSMGYYSIRENRVFKRGKIIV